jgi:hypothetical protein
MQREKDENIFLIRNTDKKKQEKEEKRKAEKRKKQEEEKSTMNWLTEETEYHTVDEEEEDKDEEEEELAEPPNYVTESGYRPNLVQVLSDYEEGEQGQCVICGTRELVDTECENCPESVSIYSPRNYPKSDVYFIPPIYLTNYGTVTMILDHMNRSTRETELTFFGNLCKSIL